MLVKSSSGCDKLFFFVFVKENIADLQENLHNVEDKLSAAETCKTMLNEEVLALRQAYDKLSSDLEVHFWFSLLTIMVHNGADIQQFLSVKYLPIFRSISWLLVDG